VRVHPAYLIDIAKALGGYQSLLERQILMKWVSALIDYYEGCKDLVD